jgi:hypothetical protein
MIPPSALVQGLLASWPYIAGAIAVASLIGFMIPVKKKEKEQVQTIVKEEIQNNVKIVTKIHRKEVAIDYDVFLKMLSDYEKAKEDAEKSLLTQLALLEAKKQEERDKQLRDVTKPEDAYKNLVKVKMNGNGKKLAKKVEDENEEEDIDTPALYKE